MSKKRPKSAVLAGKITGWVRFDVMLFMLKTTSKLVRDASMRKLTKNFTWQPWPCISQTQWNWNISVYSPQLKAYRKIFSVMCTKNCWVGSTFYFNTHFCQKQSATISALQEVTKTLWVQGKHDAGLIKNAEAVVSTSKLNYRPWQQQNPLKPEAVEGITSVIALLKKQEKLNRVKTHQCELQFFRLRKHVIKVSLLNCVLCKTCKL